MKKQQKKRVSLRKKMLVRTITPTILGLIVTSILISILVGAKIQHLENQNIKNSSENSSYQIKDYFTKYMEVSRQLATNQELLDLFQEVQLGEEITKIEQYTSVMNTMKNVHNTDTNNILVSWIADVDSSQCIEDSGYVSPIGEWDITSRSWYSEVIAAGTTIVTEPYENSSTGELVSSIITPIYGNNGELEGVAALDLSLQSVIEMMSEQQLGNTGFLFLLTQTGTIMYAKDNSILQSSILDISIDDTVKNGFSNKKYGSYIYTYNGSKNYGYMSQIGESQWVVLSGMPSKEYNADYFRVLGTIIGLFAFIILILFFLISTTAKSIVRPICQLNDVSEKIANGHLNVELNTLSNDEIGEVSISFQKTVTRLKDYISYIDEITDILNDIGNGNLNYVLKQEYAGEFEKIKIALEQIAHTLKNTIQGINTTSLQVSGGADQIAQAAQSLADGATNQANAVEELMITIKNISQQTHNNAIFAKDAAKKADLVKRDIEFSNQEMHQLVNAMEEISKCSNAIQNIISNIEEIADQTNLLSLNASIEAARAGEQGKGFAVVANEVGNLSKESVVAVQNSTKLIQNSLTSVQTGMNLVQKSATKLSASVEGVIDLANQMNQLADIANEQMESLEQVEQGIDQISHVVTDNSAMSEQSAASSEELSAQASTLNEMIGIFKI